MLLDLFRSFWSIAKGLRWSLLIALIAIMLTYYLLTETQYIHQVNGFLANGWGVYDVGIILVVVVLILLNISGIKSFVEQSSQAVNVTLVDNVMVAAVLWGVILYYGRARYAALASIDWASLSALETPTQILWFVSAWVAGRSGLGLYRLYKFFNRKDADPKPRLRADQAIGLGEADEDLLGRSNIVDQITSVITQYDSEGAFVIAVTGEWGAGKTTAINFARRALKKDEQQFPIWKFLKKTISVLASKLVNTLHFLKLFARFQEKDSATTSNRELLKDKKVIVVDFDPWYFSTGSGQNLDTLLKRFFEALENAVKPHLRTFNLDFSRLIKTYYRAIAPLVEKAPIRLDVLFEPSPKDLRTIQKELNKIIAGLEARVVVIIDDLDRMDGREIAYVFKLIRLCANFDNLTYVVAFDKPFVQRQLEDTFGARAKDYTDKIIQLELSLPQLEPTFLGQIFESRLTEISEQLKVDLLEDQNFADRLGRIFNPHITHLVNNIRLINLFTNRFLLVIPVVKGEVNYFDLLVLEIIRLRYPDIYEAIYRNPSYFVWDSFINRRELTINYRRSLNKEQADREKKQFFEKLTNGLDEVGEKAVLALLKAVFPPSPIGNFEQSVANYDYFPRYFRLAVQQGVISDVEWNDFITQINTAGEDELKSLIENKVDELADTQPTHNWLLRIRFSAQEIEKKQLPALVLAITNKVDGFSPGLALDTADYLIHILELLEASRLQETVEKIIEFCPDNYFLTKFLFDLEERKKEGSNPFAQLDTNKLMELMRDRLRSTYLENGENIVDESHRRGIYALKYFLSPEEYKPYLQRLLEQDKRNALRLLEALTSYKTKRIGSNISEDRHLDYPTVKAFMDPQQLVDIVKNYPPSSEMTDDERWALEELQRNIAQEAESKEVE